MALALCHAVRDAGLPPPTDAVLLCPWLHVALPHPDVAGLARSDVTFNVDDLRAAGLRYAGGDPVDTPLVSPASRTAGRPAAADDLQRYPRRAAPRHP